jgi:hypothetical protein
MNVKNEPGMLERIQEAVQPLTRGGEFRLNTIKYGTYFGDIRIDLDSKHGYSLIISKGESNNYITFSFYIDNLSIRSEILFNVLDLSWPFQKKYLFDELHDFCLGLQPFVSKISNGFSSQNKYDTISRYNLKKQEERFRID